MERAQDHVLAGREWWEVLPEADRRLYTEAGFTRGQSLEGKTALLVIDCTFAFTGTRPVPLFEAIQEFRTSCGEVAWRALPLVQGLLAGFRSAGLPIVFTRGDLAAAAAARGATKVSRDDDPNWVSLGNEFTDLVRPLPEEWVCEKARASAFYGTPLASYLQLHAVRSVVICGGTTSGCVRASAVDAFSEGFRVFLAEDACFDRAHLPHLVNLFDLHAKYATVLTAEQILAQVPEVMATAG